MIGALLLYMRTQVDCNCSRSAKMRLETTRLPILFQSIDLLTSYFHLFSHNLNPPSTTGESLVNGGGGGFDRVM